MGLALTQLRDDLDALAQREPALARELARIGYPAPRIRERGWQTLLRTIVVPAGLGCGGEFNVGEA